MDFKCVWCSWNDFDFAIFQRFDLLASLDWICCSPSKRHGIANTQWISSESRNFTCHVALPVLQMDCFGGLRVARNSARLAAEGQSRCFMMFLPTARKPGQRFCVFFLSCSQCYGMDCYTTRGVVGLGGVGWGVMTSLNLHTWSLLRWTCTHGRCYGELVHMVDARWCVMTSLNLHTWSLLRWTCLHGWCYATWWGGVGGEWN